MRIIRLCLVWLLLMRLTCYAQDETLGDWMKFRINAGLTLGKSYTGVPYSSAETQSHFSGISHSPISNKYVPGANLDLQFVCGTSDVVKHVVGLGYIYSNSQYHYAEYSYSPADGIGTSTSQNKDISYYLHNHYITLYSGLSFHFSKHLSLEIGAMIADNIVSTGYKTGYESQQKSISAYDSITNTIKTTSTSNTTLYNHTPETRNGAFSLSLLTRINYDFRIKKLWYGVYLGMSASPFERLGWGYLGIHIYPFKKLSWKDDDESPTVKMIHKQ